MSGALVTQKEIVTPTIQCRPFAPLSAKSKEAHSSHFTYHTTLHNTQTYEAVPDQGPV